MIVDEPVRREDVGTHEVFGGLAINAHDGGASTAAAVGVVLRLLDQAMDPLFAVQRPFPGCVHTPQHRRELVPIRTVQRFNHQLRHAHIIARKREALGWASVTQ